ncbi:MAG TPA: hypothetical protein VF266_04205 [Thermoanaerobaculia bacterium]
MPDERAESISQGIGAPPESKVGREAEERAKEKLIHTPPEAQADSAMGGTSDVDAPVDDAELSRALHQTSDDQ